MGTDWWTGGARSKLRWILLLPAVLVIAWLLRQSTIVILTVLVLLGFAPDCQRQDAIVACYRRFIGNGIQEKVRKSSSIVKEDGPYRLVETSQGPFWEVKAPDGRSEVEAQVAEIETKYARSESPVHKGDLVLDCGANVGVFTRYALTHGAKKVLAIEPAPDNLECLRRNMGNDSRVVVFPVGVWNQEDTLVLYESAEISAMDSFVEKKNTRPGVRVPLTTIDKLVEKEHLDRVDFIKMDIEGAESRALRGALQTLRRFHPRMELEATEEPELLLQVARQGWPVYSSHCILCTLELRWRLVRPILIALR